MSTHGPIEPKFVEGMQTLARMLDDILNGDERPKTIGFALLMYDFNTRGRVNYIGNGNRVDVLAALKELVARWEGTHPEEQA